jgi:hypothetical protein
MEGVTKKVIFSNWQRKLLAILLGFCLWLVIDHSITTTRTFTHVPVRVVNVPPDRAIHGLSPNGMLDRTITLTMTGKKKTIEALEPGDFEVVLDASGKESEWLVKVGSKNLVSLNPEIDLMHQVSALTHSSLILRISPLLTEKIPVFITPPRGEPPEGYQYIGIWPKELSVIVSGPEEDIRELQSKGIEYSIDLSQISAEDLLKHAQQVRGQEEIAYPVPDRLKTVAIGFLGNTKQELTGHDARQLQLFFLKQELFSLGDSIPIRVFYPIDTLDKYNPKEKPLILNDFIIKDRGITLLKKPLYAKNVSRLFLDIVKDHLELVVSLFEREGSFGLPVSVQFNDAKLLEETFVSYVLPTDSQVSESSQKEFLRSRFWRYVQQFQLYTSEKREFRLSASMSADGIQVEEITKK